MKTIIHKSETRGHANHGWLNTYHTFSFANYYNPERVHFGALRVLNDDWIARGQGFSMHPHDNMEIITIPLEGVVEHKDSMGNKGTISAGEIQVMSAGTGVFHSEYNPSANDDLRLLQIWIFPDKKNVSPRYEQISLADVEKKDELYSVVTPDPDGPGMWIHQKAWFSLGNLSAGWEGSYSTHDDKSGVYVFIISGNAVVAGSELQTRDGIGIWDTSKVDIRTSSETRLLIMEVPML